MIQGKRFWMLASTLMVVSLLLSSCAPAAAPTLPPEGAAPSAGTPAAAQKPPVPTPTLKPSGQPKYGGILTCSVYVDAPSLDPHQEVMFTPLTIAQPVMNGLVEFDPWDPGWKIRPGLAESWEISKEGTKTTFHLRKGVNWHDGKPFTSTDAKFSIERMGANPPKGAISPREMAFEPIEKIETPDDYTLLLALRHPYAEIMDLLAVGWNQTMAKHVVGPLGGSKIRKVEHVVGTGPFKLVSWDNGVGWHLVKNPDYFKKGLPYLNEIKYYVVKDSATRFSAFRTKAILIEGKSPGFSPPQIETLEKSPVGAQVVMTGSTMFSIWGLLMNTRHPGPIGDLRVRKAMHLALDRQKMQRLFAQTQPLGVMGTLIYPGSKFAIPKENIEKMPGFRQPKDSDIVEAKRLLDEAKLPKDFTLPLLVREGGVYRDHATILIEELKTFGIVGTMRTVDTATFYDVRQRGDFAAQPATIGSWYPSPHFLFSGYLITGGGTNYYGVSDERIDSLFAKQQRTLDTEERKKTFWEMDRIIREDVVPGAPLYWAVKVTGHWKEVKGYAGMGLSYYEGNRMDEVWLDK